MTNGTSLAAPRSPAHGTAISPTAPVEDQAFWSYWNEALPRQAFYIAGLPFEDYAPAFRLGRQRFREDTLLDDVLGRLGSEWEDVKGASRLAWTEARDAVRAAWEACGGAHPARRASARREP